MNLVISFLAAAGLVIAAGKVLTWLADDLAEATGVSRGFIGFLLLSSVTSLPELVTSVSATVYVHSAGMAFGNVFGSNMVNLAFVFLMDVFYEEFEEEGKVLSQLKRQEVPMALWVVLLTSLSLLGVALGLNPSTRVMVAWLSPVTLPLLLLYGLSIWSVFRSEQKVEEVDTGRPETPYRFEGSLRILVLKFVGVAAVIAVAGMWLTTTCDQIAVATGAGTTFIGVALLAFVTSLPELTVTIAAVRQGNIGMGIANLLGSCIFNLTILGLCDLASLGHSPFLEPGAVQSVPAALISMMMVGVLIFGIHDRAWRKVWRGVSFASWCLLFLYLLGTLLTYITG